MPPSLLFRMLCLGNLFIIIVVCFEEECHIKKNPNNFNVYDTFIKISYTLCGRCKCRYFLFYIFMFSSGYIWRRLNFLV